MELRHLRYFGALAASLNFTRAAERMHVTQSTLSHQIRQLEDEIGQPLFDRVGKRVVMTAAGEVFLEYAARALREIDLGLGELKASPLALLGEVRLGATHTFNLGFVPQCVAMFLEQHPSVRVVVEELPADQIADRLDGGELDVGITYRPENRPGLRFEPLYNEELMLAVAHSHPLAHRKRVRMIELHREALVLLPKSFSTRKLLDECFASVGAEPAIVAEMNSIAAILGVVARTHVGAIVASNAVPPHAGLTLLPLESPTPVRTPGLLFKADSKPSRPVQKLTALLRKTTMNHGLRSQQEAVRDDGHAGPDHGHGAAPHPANTHD